MEKVLFIYNPEAGMGTLKNKVSDVLTIFRKNNLEVTVFPTLAAGEASQIAGDRGREYSRIICAGGDGTLHEIVHGLMSLPKEERPICGYIPTGTVNDFANGIKLPRRVKNAAEVAAGEHFHPYDVGEMNGKYFSYVAAFGAFTSVAYETPQFTKNLLGKNAYILDGMTKLNTIKSVHVCVKTENDYFEDDCIFGMITNADSVGGIRIYRRTKIELDDGVFDGIFIKKPKNPVELNLAMGFLLTGKKNTQIHVIHGGEIEIQTDEPVAYTLDGEAGGTHSLVQIRNHKQAITFCHGIKKN